jgi:flagellar assembly protein FliH
MSTQAGGLAAAVPWTAPALTAPRNVPSVAQLEALETAAREEGYANGYAEGLARGEADLQRRYRDLDVLFEHLQRPLAQLDGELPSLLGETAVQLAGALIKRAYQADPGLLAALIAEAVAMLGAQPRPCEVLIHPEDLALVAGRLDHERPVRLIADDTLARGDVRVHADNLRVDATLAARLDHVAAAWSAMPVPA